jgi:hypothetical protein
VVETGKIPAPTLDAFLEVFGHHFADYDFVWRVSGGDLGQLGNVSRRFAQFPNIHPFAWTPQTSLLAHPRTK